MHTRWMIAILVLAAALRLGLLAAAWRQPMNMATPDTRGYAQLSDSLGRGEFRNAAGQPEIYRTPGYPLVLLAGTPFGDRWMQAVALLQVALDVALVYAVFVLGATLLSPRVGVWAAAWQAVSPVAVAASCRILSDSIFALLLTLSVLLLAHHLRGGRWWPLVAGAVAAGVACYLRPAGLALLAVIALVLAGRALACWRRGRPARAPAAQWAAAMIIFCVAILPWLWRNGTQTGYWHFSAIGAENIWRYEAAATVAAETGLPVDHVRQQMQRELDESPAAAEAAATGSPGPVARYKQHEGLRLIADAPATWARVHAVSSMAALLPGITDVLEIAGITTQQRGTLAVLQQQGLWAAVRHYFGGSEEAMWLALPAAVLELAKYALVLVAAAAYLRPRMGSAAWLIVLTVLVMIAIGGPAATPRFRVPVEGLLSLAAAAGVVRLAGRRHKPAEALATRPR